MKNFKKSFLVLIAAFVFSIPFIVNAQAKNVKTVDVSIVDGVISVEGTTDDGVLAVAIMVYDANEKELISLTTTSVNDDNEFSDDIVVSKDDSYVIKVANYDGGDYVTVNLEEEKSEFNVVAASTSAEDKAAAKLTNDLIKKLVNGEKVTGISDELKEKILKAIEDGKDIKVDLVKSKLDEDDIKDDASTIKKAINKKTNVVSYYNIEILVKIDDEVAGNITELDDEIDLTLDLPEDIEEVKKGYERNYYVLRLHNGEVKKLRASLAETKLKFKSGEFSTYAISYEDVTAPKTIDNIIKYLVVAIVAGGGSLGTILYFRKKIK